MKEYYMYDRLILTKAIEGDGCALVRSEQLHEALYSERITFLDGPSLDQVTAMPLKIRAW